jgi:uncharacterized protein
VEKYLLHVGLTASINLALLVPLFLLAFLTGSRPKSYTPILLFALLFVLDMGLVLMPRVVNVIPPWGGWNWQGKVLQMAWPVLLVLCVPAFAAARNGFKFPEQRSSWRALPIACVVYLLIGIPALLLLGARFSPGAPDLPMWVYEATMPGLGEEFVYRGIFLVLLNEAFGRPWKFAGIRLGWGFVIVSVMFGLLHGIDAKSLSEVQIVWGPNMFLPMAIGFVLAWIRERTGSVWPCVLFHNFVNTINDLFV